ncbi:MAG: DinB family protein [Chloroflexota bacterium]
MPTDRPHPLVLQLRFSRAEFLRGVKGVTDADGAIRLGPMNCLAWNVGHLAWQEQRYFLTFAQGLVPNPDVQETYKVGAPGVTPRLSETLAAWRDITGNADPWLDRLTTDLLLEHPMRNGKPMAVQYGNLLQRTIYHYWYHCGENQAIRQQLGHAKLGQFVGNIDDEAPYTPERDR